MLLEAIVPLHLCQHCFIDACAQFSQNAAHTSRTLSLQEVLLWQSVLCQPDTESLVIAEVHAGRQCKFRSAQVSSVKASSP